MFPIDRILAQNEFKGMEIVVCGHSLGGAIASVVAIKLFFVMEHLYQERSLKCITFGAPPIGDRDMQKYVAEKMSTCIHNFVCINDPVPKLLRSTQSVSSRLHEINTHLSAMRHSMQALDGISSAVSTFNKLIAMKDSCINLIRTIDAKMPIIQAAVNIESLVLPDFSSKFQKIFNFIADATTVTKDNRNGYVPIGNFHFLSENFSDNNFFSCDRLKEIEAYLQMKYQQRAYEVSPDVHALSYYTDLFRRNGNLPFGDYPYQFKMPTGDLKNRKICFKYPYDPFIISVELAKASGEKSFLKLSFTGKNLFDVVLDLCQFNFSFPNKMEKVKIKKVSIGENIERLVIEEETEHKSIAMSEHGINLLLVTQFGECEKILQRENLRNFVVESVHQIAENDSVSLIVRRAIERGMALKTMKMESGSTGSEEIINEIIQLGTVAIGEDEMMKIEADMFTENRKNIHFVLSNEGFFQRVKDFCNKIEEYIRSPLHIEAELNNFQMIAVGSSVVTGAAVAGWIASSSLALIGLATATGAATATATGGLVLTGGAVGAITAGATASSLINERLTDSNYKVALNFIAEELFKAQQKYLDGTSKAEITDLLDQESILPKEKALIRLAPNNTLESFGDCIISKSKKESKVEVMKRIKTIRSVHRIREIFSQQCFIGVVGSQDAGKTTLIRKIWNVGGKSGYFSHTEVPKLYQITQKLLVVDFPGSNSLDYHSKRFSICGSMNNIVIVVIPFSGDVSQIDSQEIAKVFGVMKGSDSTRVILCFNKCGLYLNKLKEDLVSQEKPADYLKQVFIDKLNNHYEKNEQTLRLSKTDIFFTDWELETNLDSVNFGIVGVEQIKDIITCYLIDYGIYKSSDTDELQRCVSFVSN